jgi:5,10-methylenetetrahydromethanopterin reductase
MQISCGFATSLDTPDHIELAERLGYSRAWCYDSPALYPDVWMTLARAAERTRVIGLGPGVLIPYLRHVMTNASAIATLEAMAPGRVAVAVGSGFTGRLALGKRPMRWSDVRDYIATLKALLRGDEVEWDGGKLRMLHRDGFGAPRPISVPVLVGASGPRGREVARELGEGVFSTSTASPEDHQGFAWVAQMTNGTVLDEGETLGSERVMAAAGHGAALVLHIAYEGGWAERLPGGAEFARALDALPAESRHLALHEGHLVGLNRLNAPFVTPEFLATYGRALTRDEWRRRLRAAEAGGVSEWVYQPAGPDIPRELTAFAEMAGLQPRG